MSVANLLTEIAKPEYVGMADSDIVALLNEWVTVYTPCTASTLQIKFAELLLPARVSLAHDKGTVDDDLFLRWELLLKFAEANDKTTVMFDTPPVFIEDLFTQLEAAGVITDPEPTWLKDLGRQQWNVSRKIFNRDLTEQDLSDARPLQALVDKVVARRTEIEQFHADVQAAHDEANKRDGSLNIIADPAFVPQWEK